MPEEPNKIENDRKLQLLESRKNDEAGPVATDEAIPAEEPEKRVNPVEAIIMLAVAGAGDGFSTLLFWLGSATSTASLTGIGIVLMPLAGASWVAGSMIKLSTWFIIDMWVVLRGFKRPKFYVPLGGVDLLPVIGDILPTYVGKIVIIIMYNNGLPWLKKYGAAARLLEHVS